MKIAVLSGGISAERNVSLCSGKNVAAALIRRGHSVALIDPARAVRSEGMMFAQSLSELENNSTCFDNSQLPPEAPELDFTVLNILHRCDKVFLALHGGAGENGKIQAVLEVFGIYYNGSSPAACAIAMDKLLTKKLLNEAGILTPSYTVYRKDQHTRPLPPRYPCVVKPANGGSSLGVTFVFRPFELENAVKKALDYCDTVLMECAVNGRELTVGILNDEPLVVTEISPVAGFYDYQNKYIPGKTVETTPARIPTDVTARALSIAKHAHRILGLHNFSRTDMIYEPSSGLLYVLEVNTLPGMTETSLLPQAAAYRGIEFGLLCEMMLF